MHGSRGDAEDSTSYEWVREYNYRVHNTEDHRTYWFHCQNGRVTYTDLSTKLSLFKRGKQATTQAFPRPSEVWAKHNSFVLLVKENSHCLHATSNDATRILKEPYSCIGNLEEA